MFIRYRGGGIGHASTRWAEKDLLGDRWDAEEDVDLEEDMGAENGSGGNEGAENDHEDEDQDEDEDEDDLEEYYSDDENTGPLFRSYSGELEDEE